jgi:spore germination protein GerM
MMRLTRPAIVALLAVATALVLGVLFVGLPRWGSVREATTEAAPGAAGGTPGRRIHATLFYAGEDGRQLVAVDREVAFESTPDGQARQLVEAQLQPPSPPHAAAIPVGTRLRGIYITGRGEAFVDLSKEVAAAHPGGTVSELLTVYALVNALTVNLPAISSVQILVEGKEVDTLAGHVDLREPRQKDLSWVAGKTE